MTISKCATTASVDTVAAQHAGRLPGDVRGQADGLGQVDAVADPARRDQLHRWQRPTYPLSSNNDATSGGLTYRKRRTRVFDRIMTLGLVRTLRKHHKPVTQRR
ncbi:hypothetical protein ACVWZW_004698 [Bradyrhizobium sp. F1.13.4]